MTSLNPLMRVGSQVVEVLEAHDVPRDEARRRALEALGDVGTAAARAGGAALPARAVRRTAAAGDDRDGRRAAADRADRRRADHGPRRHHPAAGAQPGRRAAPGDRAGAGLDHPRPRRGGAGRGARAGHVRRTGRRVRRAPATCTARRSTPTPPACSARSHRCWATERPDLPQIGGAPPDLARRPSGCAFHPRCPQRVDRCVEEEPRARAARRGPGGVLGAARPWVPTGQAVS